MSKFKTLEEAQAAYDLLLLQSKEKTAEAVKKVKEAKDKQIEDLKKELSDAKEVAQDAIDKANNPSDGFVYGKVDGKKYRVNFGVDGHTPAELVGDAKLLARLVKIGSGALTEVK